MTDQNKPEMPEPLHMYAYYYGFQPTGVREIDLILSAVAVAGKCFHHTESWTDDASDYKPDYLQGETPKEWIQNAANAASRILTAERQKIRDEVLKELHDFCIVKAAGHLKRAEELEILDSDNLVLIEDSVADKYEASAAIIEQFRSLRSKEEEA